MANYLRAVTTLEAVLVFCLALAIRLIDLDGAFGGNELFHMLAARSWADEGTFRVAYGAYPRNWEFTVLVSWFVQAFGESPFVARLPAVFAGSLSVVALFVWMRFSVGRSAAWFAAALLGVCPLALVMSQWVRAYSLQALLFFLGAIGVYMLVTRNVQRRLQIPVAVASVLLLWSALHLHLITIVGIAGLAVWVIIERRSVLGEFSSKVLRNRVLLIFTIGVVFLVSISAIFLLGDELGKLISAFRDLQPQAADRESDLLYYHKWLIKQYPLLWGGFPLIVVAAIYRKPQFGLFCTCIFVTVFIVYMFASRKWLRYLYYMMPFLCALWGFAIAEAIPRLRELTGRLIGGFNLGGQRPYLRGALSGLLIGTTALFFVTTNALLVPVYYQLVGVGSSGPDWNAVEVILAPWLDDKQAVILASPMQQPLFYYDRTDIEFGPKYIYESDSGEEFGIDKRTGLRAVSTRESLELVFRCYRRGLLLMTESHWRKPGLGPSDEVLDLLLSQAKELTETKRLGFTAFAWDRPVSASPGDCELLYPLGQAVDDRKVVGPG